MGRPKKKLKRIEVRTLPNGYSLNFDGAHQANGYMYFTADKLLEGFMLHIGLNMTEQLDTETMQNFIMSALEWNSNEKCVREIERLKRELSAMTSKRNGLARQLIEERRNYSRLRDDMEMLHAEAKNAVGDLVYELADTFLKRNRKKPDLTFKSLGVDSNVVIEDDQTDDDDGDEMDTAE
jgi:hypothetical protein